MIALATRARTLLPPYCHLSPQTLRDTGGRTNRGIPVFQAFRDVVRQSATIGKAFVKRGSRVRIPEVALDLRRFAVGFIYCLPFTNPLS